MGLVRPYWEDLGWALRAPMISGNHPTAQKEPRLGSLFGVSMNEHCCFAVVLNIFVDSSMFIITAT